MIGHSFGGATVIKSAYEDSRVKAVISLDPWLYSMYDEFVKNSYIYNKPLLIINTESLIKVWPEYL